MYTSILDVYYFGAIYVSLSGIFQHSDDFIIVPLSFFPLTVFDDAYLILDYSGKLKTST